MRNQNKNIFNFFKTQYEEKSNQDLGWNAPPEFIFEDAINQVNAQKSKKKRYLLLFLLAGFIVSGVLVTNLYLSSRINTIEQKVSALADESQSPLSSAANNPSINKMEEQRSDSDTDTAAPHSQDPQNKEATITKAEKTTAKNPNTTTRTTKQFPTSVNRPSAIPTASPSSSETAAATPEKTFTSNPLPRSTKQTFTPMASELSLPSLSTLAPLDARTNSGLAYATEGRLLDTAISFPEHANVPTQKSSGIVLSLLAKYNYSSLQMDGPGATAQSLTLYDKYYAGYGSQLNAQIPITKRLSLLGSISYDKIKNRSLLNYTMFYDDANHTSMGGNLMMYSLDSELGTPMGELEDRMRFEVDAAAYANGTAINQYADILQSMTILGLHLGPQVTWVNCNKFQWSSALQFGVNYVNKMITSVSSEYKIMNSTMSTSEAEHDSMESMKKLSTALSLSTQISYQLNDHYSITGGISTMKSLTSLRSQTPPSTKLINWSTQLGVSRRF